MPLRTRLSSLALPLVLLVSLAPGVARADQLVYIEPGTARRALEIVSKVRQLRYFCAPCRETVSTLETVVTAEIGLIYHDDDLVQVEGRPPGRHYWQLLINGEYVDLAYVYVPHEGHWRNLGMMVGETPGDVPEWLSKRHVVEGK
jgi:hypothetical protein